MQLKLNVPFSAKDRAKSLGARWDLLGKFWYVPHGLDINIFREWWPEDLSSSVLAMNERNHKKVKSKKTKTKKIKNPKIAKNLPAISGGNAPKNDPTDTPPWK